MKDTSLSKVIVVGAGPAGLLLALMLAKHGISVDVVEALDAVDARPRGAAYGPAAVSVLRRAGVLDKIRQKGLSVDSFTWRKVDGTVINRLTGMSRNPDKGGFVCLPVYDLASLLYDELCQLPNAQVYWNHRVTVISQNETRAWVECENGQKFEGDFVVGCDGGTSTVRKSLFGSNFPGHTWDVIMVATNIRGYDFSKYGWEDTSWIVDPEHWAVVALIDQQGTWRVSYGEKGSLSHDELYERMSAKLQRILPGNPTPDQYTIERFNPYNLHQRCAEKMRVGRILLAGDAAHLNNPMGGLGLTSGMSDVGGLVDCLQGIYDGKAGYDILDQYDQVRREIYRTVTDPVSTANLARVQSDPAALAGGQDPFFVLLDKSREDASFLEEIEKNDMRLLVDFTQFYDKPKVNGHANGMANGHISLTYWDRLVRYVSAKTGQTRYGEPLADLTADIDQLATEGTLKVRPLEGSNWLAARPSDEEEDLVKELLGPLTPRDVPIVRCTGLNYRTHIIESNWDIPTNPTLFIKPGQAVGDTRAPIPVPKLSQSKCDYEGELTIVIGKDAKNVSEEQALDYVAGYVVGNDVSCRDWQLDKDKAGMMPQWCFGKSFDKYAPVGPAIVSPKILGDASGLRLQTYVNGELRQDSDTSDLCFGVRKLVSFYSTGQTLEAGSLIMTGTPGGVAAAMKIPQYLQDGDEVVVEIERIGKLRNIIKFDE
ncbi:uncharacterized protein Z520_09559 [Fonsecaea multimorphosa CBS 102226]|uniref:FAD-binding domain-containing protein n=1 Tax=Fonsecaea multimorphosa CBS 102226 TaxID=1442371 RepID=A0A0D2JWI1_9EURO|nr:uncharacterized protein Z520_09559 [Fonsecaea multimorphosa CBS 102226]KIX94869.1 hypothetical protein Z520_09559 [Fonsecaea multimorphosa CBS 102226]OAL20446.1 hypothetical protein AYO22_08940 [Fonsecaea multimorphosa]